MAKYLRFMLIFLLLSISISNSPLGQSGLVTFFGPVEFVRGTGKPIVEAKDFSAFGFLPPFTLHLRNGDENGNNRVSSAEVWLNELPLFKESDFSQKVAGYDVAVSLNGSNTLKVKLNSKPGSKLAVWIEGNPPELNVTLDEAHRVIAPITSSGGTLSTTGADGTTLILTIPEGALYEEQQISLTPIVSVTGLTLSGGFLRGADLEPDGLRLLKPSTLEITPPTPLSIQNRLVGFVSSGNGKNFHLFPAFFNQTSIMFHLSHFSGYGAGDGTDEEIEATTTATPSSDEEIWAESEIAAVLAECANVYGNCVLTQQQKERIMNAFIYWFEQGIIPELGEAVSCAADLNCDTFQDLFQYMISIRNHWLEDAQLLGLDEDLLIQLMNQRFRSLVETEFEDILYDYAVICSSSTDFCGEQWGIAKRYLLVWTVLQQNGWEISNAPPPEDFCPSFLEKAVHKVKIISPSPIIISVGEKKTLELEIANMFGQKIQEVTGGKIAWESSDPTKASVDAGTGIVTGVAEGSATIRVIVTQCDMQYVDEVIVNVQEATEVASVEVQPVTKKILIDGTVKLDVIVKDSLGNVITGLPIEWTIPSAGIISFDVGSQIVTGKAVGSATITATCEGISGSSTITVVDIGWITVTPQTSSLFLGDDVQLTATAYEPNDNPIGEVEASWTSSNNDVATVDSKGLVRAVIRGQSTITATCRGHSATATINVDRSLWHVTWRAVIADNLDCTVFPIQGVANHGVWTIDGLVQGDVTIIAKGSFGEEVVAASISADYHNYFESTVTQDCAGGGSSWTKSSLVWAYHSTDASEEWKEAIWIGTYSGYANWGYAHPAIHVISDQNTEILDCSGTHSGPFNVHSEADQSIWWLLPGFGLKPSSIPAADGSGNLYYYTGVLSTMINIGFNDPQNLCPLKAVMASWEVKIERIK